MNSPNDESAVRAMLDDWCAAVRVRDTDRILTHYTDDVLAFDAIGPLRFVGLAAYGAHWRSCMEMCPGAMIFEMERPALVLAGDIGYGHYLVRCGVEREDGGEDAGWMRATVGLRREGGHWRIAHEHYSVPFDPESMKARCDLEP